MRLLFEDTQNIQLDEDVTSCYNLEPGVTLHDPDRWPCFIIFNFSVHQLNKREAHRERLSHWILLLLLTVHRCRAYKYPGQVRGALTPLEKRVHGLQHHHIICDRDCAIQFSIQRFAVDVR